MSTGGLKGRKYDGVLWISLFERQFICRSNDIISYPGITVFDSEKVRLVDRICAISRGAEHGYDVH
jgi:hypothetical protein